MPIARGHTLREQDRLRSHVVERIMCDGSVDLPAAGRALGFADDWYVGGIPELLQMQKDRLLTYTDGKVLLLPEGIPLARVVDSYLRDSAVRHSIAV